MKNSILVLLFVFVFSFALSAQVHEKDAVPKQYSFELGYRYIASNNFDNQTNFGVTYMFDYAWQLSGFTKKSASYISVPLGYTMLYPAGENDKKMSVLSYGWTVRHELSKDRKVIPFFGYSLLLNQLRIKETDGTIFGHQTKFDGGININTSGRLKYFTKIEYSFTRYPSLNKDKSNTIHAFELKCGVRF